MENDEVVRLLRRNNELLTLIAKATVAEVLERELADEKHRKLYELTGTEPKAKLAKKLRVSGTTVSQLWQRWAQIGLVVKDGQQYRRTLD